MALYFPQRAAKGVKSLGQDYVGTGKIQAQETFPSLPYLTPFSKRTPANQSRHQNRISCVPPVLLASSRRPDAEGKLFHLRHAKQYPGLHFSR
jgi:hypothetical protein